MKSLSFAFIVTLYLVCTDINCNINSNYLENAESIFNRTLLSRGDRVTVPLAITEQVAATPELDIDLVESLIDEDAPAKNCLKNMSSCFEKDDLHQDATRNLHKYLLSTIPPFDPSKTKGVSKSCKTQSRRYMEDLAKFKFWALQMYDSSAKIPSGLLNGNVNQFGDYDVCLRANLKEENIYGQYCLAALQVERPDSIYLAALHRLLQSHSHFKSRMEDPGHRVPRYSSINWALCVPDGCTNEDVQLVIQDSLRKIFRNTDFKIQSQVSSTMCQTSRPKALPLSTILGMSFFIGFAIFIGFATLYDFVAVDDANVYVTSFSLRKNWNSLISVKKNDDIKAVHGIRFLNSLLLLLAHKSMAIFFVPYQNRTEMVEFIAKPWTVLARAASLYTDPFIMIAGMLTAHSFIGKLEKTNKINIMQEYINRLFRIVPTFAALIAFCTFVLPWIDSGPMWNQVITHHSDICKQNWWRNLLFIHNYYGFGDMCLTHTHHIGIDTQLFFTSPLLILLLWKYPKKGLGVLLFLAIGSTIFRYYVTYTLRLSNYIHFGTSIQQLFDTADNMYILPIHRATVYIMGILLGYYLRKLQHFRLSKIQIRIGNSIALLSFLASFLGPSFMGSIKYVYNPTDAAWYAAFAPIFWCITFGWIIFSTQVGHESSLGKFFSWPGFSLWTNISYTVYLTQFPIFFYNVGTIKSPEQYSFWRTNINIHEIFAIIASSVVLTLLFEMPFQNIRNIILKKDRRKLTENDQDALYEKKQT
ncbi:hypothetical protein WA026_010571 [Henosepilachna vigintioctopunctata]|uniref:Nose resistant-to-fluoxetine protein N-terminal domain-containing protein n=1 Tax=Henosepilachna vigintioctopunctata TaxID=420089 RepID=A0AAW1VA72_9CUCU